MTREEYNEYRYIKSYEKKFSLDKGTLLTIRVNASSDYKHKLDELYASWNFHPASVTLGDGFGHKYDDGIERIHYIYGRNDVYHDYYGKPYTWQKLYTQEELERFEKALD